LRLIAKKTKVKHLQPGHFLYTCDTKDENMYKVLKGEVTVKKPKDGTIIVKSKADLL
jgi:CRP-like cAMP-binding protein